MSFRSKNIITQSDREELKKAYKFVLDSDDDQGQDQDHGGAASSAETNENAGDDTKFESSSKSMSGSTRKRSSTRWQDRMVDRYHEHLYKTHVIADLTQIGGADDGGKASGKKLSSAGRIGLRWRTETEVKSGKGVDTCGNKHCPCYYKYCNDDPHQKLKKSVEEVILWKSRNENIQQLNHYLSLERIDEHEYGQGQGRGQHGGDRTMKVQEQEEYERLQRVEYGLGLHNYEVHFSYMEHGKKKEELVQLKLCLRCAPKLFHDKGGAMGARRARMASRENEKMDFRADTVDNGDNVAKDDQDDMHEHDRLSQEKKEDDIDHKKHHKKKRKKKEHRNSKRPKKRRNHHS